MTDTNKPEPQEPEVETIHKPEPAPLADAQNKLVAWGTECFGQEHMADAKVRSLRLLEEAIEFCQATGANAAKCCDLVGYVYSRPVGEAKQELGGIGVTWLVAAAALGVSAEDCLHAEMNRIQQKPPEHFRQRNQHKLDAGFTGEPADSSRDQRMWEQGRDAAAQFIARQKGADFYALIHKRTVEQAIRGLTYPGAETTDKGNSK